MTVSVLAVLAAAWTVPAGALAAPVSTGTADFAVSTSAERLLPDADGVIRTRLTISNQAEHAQTLKIRSAGVVARNDGQTEFTDRPDPVWSSGAKYPGTLTLAAHTYRRIAVSLTVPTAQLPDIYLLGFVVEAQPQSSASGIRVYHQIGALVTVELPGPRQREMAVELSPTGFIHLGATFSSTYQVRNVGAAAALGRGQVKVDSTITHANVGVYRGSAEVQLFPSGTSRRLNYQYEAHGLFLIARPQVQVLYGGGNGLLQMVEGNGQAILVVPWLTLILLGVTAVLLTAYLYWLRRRRVHGRHRATVLRRPGKQQACAV